MLAELADQLVHCEPVVLPDVVEKAKGMVLKNIHKAQGYKTFLCLSECLNVLTSLFTASLSCFLMW